MVSFKTLIFIHALAFVSAFDSSAFEVNPDWSSVRSNIDTSFSCEGRDYGYYADVANDCQLYHVCNPNGGTVQHNAFICPAGTVFDQRLLTCTHLTPEFSCPEQANHYGMARTNSVLDNSVVTSNQTDSKDSTTPVAEISDNSEVANQPVVSSSSTVSNPTEDSSEVSHPPVVSSSSTISNSPVVSRSSTVSNPTEDSSEVLHPPVVSSISTISNSPVVSRSSSISHPTVESSDPVTFRGVQNHHSSTRGSSKGQQCQVPTKCPESPTKSPCKGQVPTKSSKGNSRFYRRT